MLGELHRWERSAARYGVTLSELVRAALNRQPVRVVAVADPALISEYKRLGNLMNQMLHAIHGGFPVAAVRVEPVIDDIRTLIRREIGQR